jgi:hypothetical protein
LPTGSLNQCEQLLALGLHIGSFGTAGRRLLPFSTLCNVDERLILEDILQAAYPTGSPFLARRVPPRNILCLGFVVYPYAVPAETVE